jgi:phenylpropionate dioxygenase-like ring-hydroxylating dioxygenase large terminal subunit
VSTHPAADRPGNLVGDDRFDVSLYTDPQVFDLEMERIFHGTWVWVAHESEVASPGDYKMATVGTQPVIVTRDRQGRINVLVNRCRHRGASVCETPRGNGNGFTCPYHAWSYALDGTLRGVPYPAGYEDVMEKTDLPLQRLRVETYAGLVFASFNHDVQPLDDFLGRAKYWIDLFMRQGAGFPIKTLGEHRFRFKGNWKIQLENSTDAYHFPIVHRSFMASVDAETAGLLSFMTDENAVVKALGNGHSVAVMVPSLADLDADDGAPILERFRGLADELAADFDPAQVRRMIRSLNGCGFNVNLFPNVSLSTTFFRVLHPIAVDETEIRHVALGLDGGPEVINRQRMRMHEHFQGPFGFGTPDDSEAWDRVQRGAVAGPTLPILVNRGIKRESISDDGVRTSQVTDETGMREAYSMWKAMMSDVD